MLHSILLCNSKPCIEKEKINEKNTFICVSFLFMMMGMFRLFVLMFCMIIFISGSKRPKMSPTGRFFFIETLEYNLLPFRNTGLL